MRPIRVYSDEPLASRHEHALSPSASGHVLRVLRLREGDALTLFDGRGGEYPARIARAGKQGVVVVTGERVDSECESPLPVTLLQGLVRSEKMDWIVQKATELGVARIIPVVTARSVMRIDADGRGARKVAHWRAIAAAACEQCGRNRLPAIDAPIDLRAALAVAEASAGARLLLSPLGEDPLATAASSTGIALLVGPEGGFEDPEVAAAARHGFRVVRFGPRVLRAETAAIAAVTALQVLAGDLQGGRPASR